MAREGETGTCREVYPKPGRIGRARVHEERVCRVVDALMTTSMRHQGFASPRQLAEAAVEAVDRP